MIYTLSPMGMAFAFIAGLFTSLTNLCVRKGVDFGGSAKAFFAFQILSAALFAFFIGPLKNSEWAPPFFPALLGIGAGLILAIMLYSLGRAVEEGPSGLTFAILSSATMMPGLLMALLFGATYGFLYKTSHACGSLLVLIGLFWGAKKIQGIRLKIWIFFALVMFLFHTLLLGLYQFRAMLIKLPEYADFSSEWFAPLMFLSCGLIQLFIYLYSEWRVPKRGEVCFGIIGGATNLLCTFFLLLAAGRATPVENAMIFPMFSVVSILLTNLWSQKLYSEQINWRACLILIVGLIIGTVDWKVLYA